jgi:hypothetical protein
MRKRRVHIASAMPHRWKCPVCGLVWYFTQSEISTFRRNHLAICVPPCVDDSGHLCNARGGKRRKYG